MSQRTSVGLKLYMFERIEKKKNDDTPCCFHSFSSLSKSPATDYLKKLAYEEFDVREVTEPSVREKRP